MNAAPPFRWLFLWASSLITGLTMSLSEKQKPVRGDEGGCRNSLCPIEVWIGLMKNRNVAHSRRLPVPFNLTPCSFYLLKYGFRQWNYALHNLVFSTVSNKSRTKFCFRYLVIAKIRTQPMSSSSPLPSPSSVGGFTTLHISLIFFQNPHLPGNTHILPRKETVFGFLEENMFMRKPASEGRLGHHTSCISVRTPWGGKMSNSYLPLLWRVCCGFWMFAQF